MSTNTTSSLNLGWNLALLNALKALPKMSDLTTFMLFADGGCDSKSTFNSSVLNIACSSRWGPGGDLGEDGETGGDDAGDVWSRVGIVGAGRGREGDAGKVGGDNCC